MKGAKHLSFTDFTQNNLARGVPKRDTRILIYCNNNFEGDQTDFATKVADPLDIPKIPSETIQFAEQAKPLMMALTIPTYNVYELDELVDVKDPRIESVIGKQEGVGAF